MTVDSGDPDQTPIVLPVAGFGLPLADAPFATGRYGHAMTRAMVARAWFQDGPAAGAVRLVECEVDGHPPALLMFRGGQLFVATSDKSAPVLCATYELRPAPVAEGIWSYRHITTLQAEY